MPRAARHVSKPASALRRWFLARNHALVDGNKRTAWTLMVLLLWINGYRHDMGTDTAFALVLGVARGELELAEAAALIRPHLVTR